MKQALPPDCKSAIVGSTPTGASFFEDPRKAPESAGFAGVFVVLMPASSGVGVTAAEAALGHPEPRSAVSLGTSACPRTGRFRWAAHEHLRERRAARHGGLLVRRQEAVAGVFKSRTEALRAERRWLICYRQFRNGS